ncbi:FlhC family transcriptional regulator [Polaromonas naphthalenivorans]|uniref:Transcriptional activator FlhC n=1 Tax=Polaromonas naphthalenivorans (strain CJ2) TaxID=365044 RepID=A1VVD0_POLNA|nr:FlhC family transcriptional regulator [Polaromonas naphthalenivorans]ABM39608.1 hypothetical protein Pnap_4326 [Polaromonas naphthalenivorans CJ2]
MSRLKKSEAVYPWAVYMARMLARNPIIVHALGLTKREGETIWKKTNNRSSPSGQFPSNHDWYLETTDRRFQGALFILMYQKALTAMPRELALPHTYYHFSNITAGEWKGPKGQDVDGAFRNIESDYALPYSRAFNLIAGYHNEQNPQSRHTHLVVKCCKGCLGKYLARFDEGGSKCPLCL